MMPQIQVDKGAIKHVLRGSNIMCPGVTSPGGKLDDVEANTVVVSIKIIIHNIYLYKYIFFIICANIFI